MDFESAWESAIRMLDERGQLLNGHLFRLVEGDDQLFRQIRSRLIEDGIAEDRSGAGLVRSSMPLRTAIAPKSNMAADNAGLPHTDIASPLNSFELSELHLDGRIHVPDWWLMSSGVIQGPMDLVTLCTMKQRGEIRSADVIRQGLDGFWQRPEDNPLLAALANMNLDELEVNDHHSGVQPRPRPAIQSNAVPGGASLTPIAEGLLVGEDAELEKSYSRPAKSWSIQHRRVNWLSGAWHSAAALVGGSKRLFGLFAGIAIFALLAIWWRQPPPSKAVFQEFTQIRAAVRRLQEKRAPQSEFEAVSARYRPRVKSIADRLKRVASTDRPLEDALYHAAVSGLLPMLDHPLTPGSALREFDLQMDTANKLLGGPPAG